MMADIQKILTGIINVGTQVAPLLGDKGAKAVAAANALSQLLADAKAMAGPQDAAKLDDLQTQVNAHADRTIDNLRGTSGGAAGGGASPGG
jgi:hypothetical protein